MIEHFIEHFTDEEWAEHLRDVERQERTRPKPAKDAKPAKWYDDPPARRVREKYTNTNRGEA